MGRKSNKERRKRRASAKRASERLKEEDHLIDTYGGIMDEPPDDFPTETKEWIESLSSFSEGLKVDLDRMWFLRRFLNQLTVVQYYVLVEMIMRNLGDYSMTLLMVAQYTGKAASLLNHADSILFTYHYLISRIEAFIASIKEDCTELEAAIVAGNLSPEEVSSRQEKLATRRNVAAFLIYGEDPSTVRGCTDMLYRYALAVETTCYNLFEAFTGEGFGTVVQRRRFVRGVNLPLLDAHQPPPTGIVDAMEFPECLVRYAKVRTAPNGHTVISRACRRLTTFPKDMEVELIPKDGNCPELDPCLFFNKPIQFGPVVYFGRFAKPVIATPKEIFEQADELLLLVTFGANITNEASLPAFLEMNWMENLAEETDKLAREFCAVQRFFETSGSVPLPMDIDEQWANSTSDATPSFDVKSLKDQPSGSLLRKLPFEGKIRRKAVTADSIRLTVNDLIAALRHLASSAGSKPPKVSKDVETRLQPWLKFLQHRFGEDPEKCQQLSSSLTATHETAWKLFRQRPRQSDKSTEIYEFYHATLVASRSNDDVHIILDQQAEKLRIATLGGPNGGNIRNAYGDQVSMHPPPLPPLSAGPLNLPTAASNGVIMEQLVASMTSTPLTDVVKHHLNVLKQATCQTDPGSENGQTADADRATYVVQNPEDLPADYAAIQHPDDTTVDDTDRSPYTAIVSSNEMAEQTNIEDPCNEESEAVTSAEPFPQEQDPSSRKPGLQAGEEIMKGSMVNQEASNAAEAGGDQQMPVLQEDGEKKPENKKEGAENLQIARAAQQAGQKESTLTMDSGMGGSAHSNTCLQADGQEKNQKIDNEGAGDKQCELPSGSQEAGSLALPQRKNSEEMMLEQLHAENPLQTAQVESNSQEVTETDQEAHISHDIDPGAAVGESKMILQKKPSQAGHVHESTVEVEAENQDQARDECELPAGCAVDSADDDDHEESSMEEIRNISHGRMPGCEADDEPLQEVLEITDPPDPGGFEDELNAIESLEHSSIVKHDLKTTSATTFRAYQEYRGNKDDAVIIPKYHSCHELCTEKLPNKEGEKECDAAEGDPGEVRDISHESGTEPPSPQNDGEFESSEELADTDSDLHNNQDEYGEFQSEEQAFAEPDEPGNRSLSTGQAEEFAENLQAIGEGGNDAENPGIVNTHIEGLTDESRNSSDIIFQPASEENPEDPEIACGRHEQGETSGNDPEVTTAGTCEDGSQFLSSDELGETNSDEYLPEDESEVLVAHGRDGEESGGMYEDVEAAETRQDDHQPSPSIGPAETDSDEYLPEDEHADPKAEPASTRTSVAESPGLDTCETDSQIEGVAQRRHQAVLHDTHRQNIDQELAQLADKRPRELQKELNDELDQSSRSDVSSLLVDYVQSDEANITNEQQHQHSTDTADSNQHVLDDNQLEEDGSNITNELALPEDRDQTKSDEAKTTKEQLRVVDSESFTDLRDAESYQHLPEDTQLEEQGGLNLANEFVSNGNVGGKVPDNDLHQLESSDEKGTEHAAQQDHKDFEEVFSESGELTHSTGSSHLQDDQKSSKDPKESCPTLEKPHSQMESSQADTSDHKEVPKQSGAEGATLELLQAVEATTDKVKSEIKKKPLWDVHDVLGDGGGSVEHTPDYKEFMKSIDDEESATWGISNDMIEQTPEFREWSASADKDLDETLEAESREDTEDFQNPLTHADEILDVDVSSEDTEVLQEEKPLTCADETLEAESSEDTKHIQEEERSTQADKILEAESREDTKDPQNSLKHAEEKPDEIPEAEFSEDTEDLQEPLTPAVDEESDESAEEEFSNHEENQLTSQNTFRNVHFCSFTHCSSPRIFPSGFKDVKERVRGIPEEPEDTKEQSFGDQGTETLTNSSHDSSGIDENDGGQSRTETDSPWNTRLRRKSIFATFNDLSVIGTDETGTGQGFTTAGDEIEGEESKEERDPSMDTASLQNSSEVTDLSGMQDESIGCQTHLHDLSGEEVQFIAPSSTSTPVPKGNEQSADSDDSEFDELKETFIEPEDGEATYGDASMNSKIEDLDQTDISLIRDLQLEDEGLNRAGIPNNGSVRILHTSPPRMTCVKDDDLSMLDWSSLTDESSQIGTSMAMPVGDFVSMGDEQSYRIQGRAACSLPDIRGQSPSALLNQSELDLLEMYSSSAPDLSLRVEPSAGLDHGGDRRPGNPRRIALMAGPGGDRKPGVNVDVEAGGDLGLPIPPEPPGVETNGDHIVISMPQDVGVEERSRGIGNRIRPRWATPDFAPTAALAGLAVGFVIIFGALRGFGLF